MAQPMPLGLEGLVGNPWEVALLGSQVPPAVYLELAEMDVYSTRTPA